MRSGVPQKIQTMSLVHLGGKTNYARKGPAKLSFSRPDPPIKKINDLGKWKSKGKSYSQPIDYHG